MAMLNLCPRIYSMSDWERVYIIFIIGLYVLPLILFSAFGVAHYISRMDLFIILVFILVFLISGMVLSKPKGLPPGPMAWPFFGCISIMRQFSKKRPHLVLYEAAKKYGNIMSLRFGQRQIVVLSGYDAIHEALVKHADVFSDRPTYLSALSSLLEDGGGKLYYFF